MPNDDMIRGMLMERRRIKRKIRNAILRAVFVIELLLMAIGLWLVLVVMSAFLG